MKKLIVPAILLFILSGCFGGGGATTPAEIAPAPDESSSLFQNGEFSVLFPKEWDEIDQNEFTSDVPPETVVVFRDNVKNERFTPNANVVRHTLSLPTDSIEYGKLVYNRQSTGLTDFKEISKIERDILIGKQLEKSTLLVFDARIKPGEKLIRYIQTYATKGNLAFIVTGSLLPDETQNTVQKIENIIKSFALK